MISENIERKKLKLLNAYIKNTDHNSFIKEINSQLENPFFLFDVAFRLYMTSIDGKPSGKYLVKEEKNYLLSSEVFKLMRNNGDLEELKNSTNVIVKKYSFLTHPVMFKRIYDEKNTYGYIAVYCKVREFSDDDKVLLELMSDLVIHYLSSQGYSSNLVQLLFNRVVDGVLTSKEEITRNFDNLGINNREPKRLMVVKTSKPQQLYTYLVRKNAENHVFIHGEDIVCFIDSKKDLINSVIKDFVKEINDEKLLVGVSDEFKDYADSATFFRQALESIDIGKKYASGINVFYYENYRVLSLINRIDPKEIEKVIDSRVKRIIEYDKQNGTSYLNDMDIYFKYGRNINKAAKAQFIHKNSMYYRLDKINDLFNLDLENENDCFNIELSLKLIQLLNKDN